MRLTCRHILWAVHSNILVSQALLRGASRHLAPAGRLAFELLNPYWLEAGADPTVRVVARRADQVDLEIEYVTGQVQEATVPLLWPEEMEEFCSAGGLRLRRLGATDGGSGLQDASSFWVVAER